MESYQRTTPDTNMNQGQGSSSRLHALCSDTLVLDDKLWIGLAVVKYDELPKTTPSRLRYNTVVPDDQDHLQSDQVGI
jgi:hypothetical protein